MKTLLKTLAASSLAIVLSTSVFAATQTGETVKPVKSIYAPSFERIKVKGNVELTIVQGNRTGVSYADDNTGKVKVIQNGGGLEISSADQQVAKITVYVKNLYRIHATENAKVKTEGTLNVKYLQVFLSDNASLNLNSKSEGLYSVIEDSADLTLSGSTGEHTLVMGKSQKLTMDNFTALATNASYENENAFASLSK